MCIIRHIRGRRVTGMQKLSGLQKSGNEWNNIYIYIYVEKHRQDDVFLLYMLTFAIDKLRLSMYLCTSSGVPPLRFGSVCRFQTIFPIPSDCCKIVRTAKARKLNEENIYVEKHRQDDVFLLYMLTFAIDKLCLSMYVCTEISFKKF